MVLSCKFYVKKTKRDYLGINSLRTRIKKVKFKNGIFSEAQST
jgi:hypothetical protein